MTAEEKKEAQRQYMREYRAKNRERIKAYNKAWRDKNPDKVRAGWQRYYRKLAAESGYGSADRDEILDALLEDLAGDFETAVDEDPAAAALVKVLPALRRYYERGASDMYNALLDNSQDLPFFALGVDP